MSSCRRLAVPLVALALAACGPGATGADASVPTTCRSDRDCSATGRVCDRTQGSCVECVGNADCPGSGRMCLRNACVEVVSCTSSRMCPGQVCDTTRGYCVDCVGDVDCDDTQLCQEGACVMRPRPCRSSRECSDQNQVCDTGRGHCVDCVADTDCAAGETCGPTARCLRSGPPPTDASTGDGTSPPADAEQDAGTDAGPSCEAPRLRCGGSCVDPATDAANCGACGVACAGGTVCAGGACMALNPCTAAARARSGVGCEYWATTLANSQLAATFSFAIGVTNPQSADVDVTVSGGALSAPMTYRVSAGGGRSIMLPWVAALSQHGRTDGTTAASARATNGAYHVVATAPVSVWQFNPVGVLNGTMDYSYTNDVSLLVPAHALANRYVVSTRAGWQSVNSLGVPGASLGGFVAIVGTAAEGTDVTVTLTAPVVAGGGVSAVPASVASYRLAQGEVVQLVSTATTADLTGTVVEASRPVAVFGGHDCANVPPTRPACDHLEEQLLPLTAWGRTHIVSQPADRASTQVFRARILAQTAGTTLRFEGIAAPAECPASLAAGAFCEFETAASFAVTSSEPVQVMQYMVGAGAAVTTCTGTPVPDRAECRGDPSMITEVATERFRSSYDVLVPQQYTRNMINVIVPEGASATLDGVPLAGASTTPLAGHRVFFAQVTEGRHRVEAVPATARIGLKLYGSAPYASYGTTGGLDY